MLTETTTMSVLEESLKPMLGVWKCDNSRTENFEEFLAAMGVNFIGRKMAKRASPTLSLAIEGANFVDRTQTPFNTKVTSVPLDGTVVDVVQYAGATSKSHFEYKDGKAIIVNLPSDPKIKKTVLSRHIVNGELVQILDVGDGEVVCKRVFVR
ncbi:sodium/calcium exchanger regulatory protein 1-like [Watersipora subatra]|uniref:sodium/calcium exchanger regulatory protein 1-like n=1 Tax=Watersipora subatra TaxID=2589382 RepID=UPI00355BD732